MNVDSSAAEDASTALLEAYANVLEQITLTPYVKALHLEHVRITKELGFGPELENARSLMSTYFPLPEGEVMCPY